MSPRSTEVAVGLRLRVGGRVQGVGFRPFVYRLAHRFGLRGWVQNRSGTVEIAVWGASLSVEAFQTALLTAAPPLARPVIHRVEPADADFPERFLIRGSCAEEPGARGHPHIPPDFFACDDCVRELFDPADRRYRYPFINCTQCGPRYTLIDRLPYDRPNTVMAGFALCPACRAEYMDPLDRRFHAQPLACPACGPQVRFTLGGEEESEGTGSAGWEEPRSAGERGLASAVAALRRGWILAVKGIGGYHLMCDAANEEAVSRLRRDKPRPHKPLAVMLPQAGADGLTWARRVAALEAEHAVLLADSMRPIVLCPKHPLSPPYPLAQGIAPGLGEVGLMLPYSPLHHILLHDLDRPVVVTSGNISGEPVLTEPDEAERRLGRVAQGFLHHNRPIRRPADDAVFRIIGGRPSMLRPGRGGAPLEQRLLRPVAAPTLAVGGQMKNTVALAWGDRVVVSPHIGELDTRRGMIVFRQVAEDLQQIYGVQAERVACDPHPDYDSSRWARDAGLEIVRVYHHEAHASALAGEHQAGSGNDLEPLLVFAWDGAGYGRDGTIWGGEALLGTPGAWRRFASFRPFRLPGGDRAAREPWRAALALCWEAGTELPWTETGCDVALLRQAWEKGLNCPIANSVGRLFDAAAAFTGLVKMASFEAQGPMWLEAAACGDPTGDPLPLARDPEGLWRTDWEPLLSWLPDASLPVGIRAARFHAALARTILDQARQARDTCGVTTVGLTGGVFQNRLLSQSATEHLKADGFSVLHHEQIPSNDGGLSFGQIVEAAASPTR